MFSLSNTELDFNNTTMNETPPTAGKLMPPALNKRGVNNSEVSKQTASREIEPANLDKSPPKKKKPTSQTSASESGGLFEVTGASRELYVLFSKFSEVLSERAAADTSQMKQLEGILTEAQNLEAYLKEKKSHLRQTLALISDKLQS